MAGVILNIPLYSVGADFNNNISAFFIRSFENLF